MTLNQNLIQGGFDSDIAIAKSWEVTGLLLMLEVGGCHGTPRQGVSKENDFT